MRVSPDGKPSRTDFRCLSVSEHFSLVEAKPITGRTHQIRVHAAFSGYPIVGDDKYIEGQIQHFHGMEKTRLMLHARQITFTLPNGRSKTLVAQYDERFAEALRAMELTA